MKTLKENYQLVIENTYYGSFEPEEMWDARKNELESLREELEKRNYIDGRSPRPEFQSHIEYETVYICESCLFDHDSANKIRKCPHCGIEICENCDYELEEGGWCGMCERNAT